ncbi:MAG: hypothetical protein KIT81_13085 [Alphaproteobacteria bacterium]|nr:hypothetical protein [Alphaproteobacteria bacterium]
MDTSARKAIINTPGQRGFAQRILAWLRLAADQTRFLWRDAALRLRRRHVRLADLRLPSIDGAYPDAAALGRRLLLYTACDPEYFGRYYETLVLSLERHSPGVALHLHIFDPRDRAHLALIEDLRRRCPSLLLTCTEELVDAPGRDAIYRITYYASMRFLRLHEMMRATGRDVLSIDVDTLVLRPLGELLDFVAGADVSFRARFRHPDPRRRMLAGVIWFRHSPAALAYLGRVARRIALHLLEPDFPVQWYLDQRLLHLEFRRERLRPRGMKWRRLHRRFIDWHYDEGSVIWVGKGKRKDENRRYLRLGEKLRAARPDPRSSAAQ